MADNQQNEFIFAWKGPHTLSLDRLKCYVNGPMTVKNLNITDICRWYNHRRKFCKCIRKDNEIIELLQKAR